MTRAPRLKPISVTGLCPCSLDRRTSASCFPTSADRRQQTPHGLSITDASVIREDGHAIAFIIPIKITLNIRDIQ